MGTALLDEFGLGDARERAESWRYSKLSLRALSQLDFIAATADVQLPDALIARFDWPHTRGRRLVLVNGGLSHAHSDLCRADDIQVRHSAENHLIVSIAADCTEPLHLVSVSVPAAAPSRWKATFEVHVHSGSASLIEQHVGVKGADVVGELLWPCGMAANTQLSVTTLSDLPESVSLYRREQVTLAAAAAYRSTLAIFGGRLQRFDVDIALAGERARVETRGVFALRARQHADVHLRVSHNARDTTSDVLWRGVADQRARGILHGGITVAAGADGADAQLQTKNLLLSPHAEIDVQPVLEIYADEVKASHGATVGQLDERALFYLRSRGIALGDARALLIAGFCREAFDVVSDEFLRAHLEALLAERLPQTMEAAA